MIIDQIFHKGCFVFLKLSQISTSVSLFNILTQRLIGTFVFWYFIALFLNSATLYNHPFEPVSQQSRTNHFNSGWICIVTLADPCCFWFHFEFAGCRPWGIAYFYLTYKATCKTVNLWCFFHEHEKYLKVLDANIASYYHRMFTSPSVNPAQSTANPNIL